MNEINIVTAQNVTLRIELANIGDRFIASILDFLVKFGAIIGVGLLISLLRDSGGGASVILYVIIFVVFVFYSLVFEFFMNGQTPGKRMMKIRVARLDGEPVDFGNILLRWLFRLIDIPVTWPVIGITTIVASDKNQRVGDLVAGTILVSTKERRSLKDTFYTPAEPGYVPLFPRVDQLTARQAEIISEVLHIYETDDKYDLVTLLAGRIKELLQVDTRADDLTFLRTIIKDYNQTTSTEANDIDAAVPNNTDTADKTDDHSKWMPPGRDA